MPLLRRPIPRPCPLAGPQVLCDDPWYGRALRSPHPMAYCSGPRVVGGTHHKRTRHSIGPSPPTERAAEAAARSASHTLLMRTRETDTYSHGRAPTDSHSIAQPGRGRPLKSLTQRVASRPSFAPQEVELIATRRSIFLGSNEPRMHEPLMAVLSKHADPPDGTKPHGYVPGRAGVAMVTSVVPHGVSPTTAIPIRASTKTGTQRRPCNQKISGVHVKPIHSVSTWGKVCPCAARTSIGSGEGGSPSKAQP